MPLTPVKAASLSFDRRSLAWSETITPKLGQKTAGVFAAQIPSPATSFFISFSSDHLHKLFYSPLITTQNRALELAQFLKQVFAVWHLIRTMHHLDIANDALFVNHKERTLRHTCHVPHTIHIDYLPLRIEI
jgi:hypothetical protein